MITAHYYKNNGEYLFSEKFDASAPDLYQQIEDYVVNTGWMLDAITYEIEEQ